jgi:catechol 2,3-dioxygenase-like lactoylglutathione lyase family enzyme
MAEQVWCGFIDTSKPEPDLSSFPSPLRLARVPAVLVRSETRPAPVPGILGFAPLGQVRGEIVIALDTFAKIAGANAANVLPNGWPAEDVGYPVLVPKAGGGSEVSLDANLHLPTPAPYVAAINMSLGPPDASTPFSPFDPVTYALGGVASTVLPVLSAGNSGQESTGQETMSAWAEAPWVVAVGATADEAGRQLANYSSVGTPNIPDSGPDLVSYGASELDYRTVGTSFAAPRVARCTAVAASALFTLRHFIQKARGEALTGIPISGVAYIDMEIHPVDEPWPMRALPAAGIDEKALAATLAKLDAMGVTIDLQVGPDVLRQVAFAAAREMSYPQYEVGHGFLNYDTLLSFLGSFSGAHLAWLFGQPRPGSEQLAALAGDLLFDRAVLPDLFSVWRQATVIWAWDYRRKLFVDIDGAFFDPATGARVAG